MKTTFYLTWQLSRLKVVNHIGLSPAEDLLLHLYTQFCKKKEDKSQPKNALERTKLQ